MGITFPDTLDAVQNKILDHKSCERQLQELLYHFTSNSPFEN